MHFGVLGFGFGGFDLVAEAFAIGFEHVVFSDDGISPSHQQLLILILLLFIQLHKRRLIHLRVVFIFLLFIYQREFVIRLRFVVWGLDKHALIHHILRLLWHLRPPHITINLIWHI